MISCDADTSGDNGGSTHLCDRPATWRSEREHNGDRFILYFCERHEDRARLPVPNVRIVRVDWIDEVPPGDKRRI